MFGSLRYFIKEYIKNIYINGFMSLASIMVMVCCLVLTGMSFLVYKNLRGTLKSIENDNSITIYLKYDNKIDVNEVQNEIKSIPNIASCTLYSKDEAMKEYESILGDSVMSLMEGEENPLPDAFNISMEDLSKYEDTVAQIMVLPYVDSISDRSDIARRLSDFKKLLTLVGFWVTFGLSIVSLMIISNTVRMTMYNRRFEISIMKSVGATNGFIRAPFIVEGTLLGLMSAVFSTLILYIICGQAIELISKFMPLNVSSFNETFKDIFIVFVVVGSLLGIFASVISIKRYLKKEGGLPVAW